MELVCGWPHVLKLFPFVGKALLLTANQSDTAIALRTLAFASTSQLPAEDHWDPARLLLGGLAL